MRYLPQTQDDIRQMCHLMGIDSPQTLMDQCIPQALQFKKNLNVPKPSSEKELLAHLSVLGDKNHHLKNYSSFLGSGAYDHYIPAAVGQLASRGEFTTSYTPYQAELSQGTLQAIFEFQTMVASLTGMEISNASTYDGSTSLSEAILMAARLSKKKKILLAASIHPQYKEVVRSTLQSLDYELVEVGFDIQSGQIDLKDLEKKQDDSCAALCVQSPNFFGVIENLSQIGAWCTQKDTYFVASATEALSYALLKSPGSCGADIVTAEGQSFGNALNLGGPYLGLFATKMEYIRQMPGRVVGESVDEDGRRSFVLTFNTREQHIRREKATSNICTNQSLCALYASIYLSLMGPQGLKQLAQINLSKTEYLKNALRKIEGVKIPFSAQTFNEFVIQTKKPVLEVLKALEEKSILGGHPLVKDYPILEESLVLCVTEQRSKEELDLFTSTMREILS